MLENRVAIVTGGLQGIGLAIAKALTDQGVRVAVGSRRGDDAEASESARRAIGDSGIVRALDVASTDSVNDFIAQVESGLGTPDILVNAAGVGVHQIVEGHSDEHQHLPH